MHMTRNVGPEDRVVRIVVAIGLAVIIYAGVLDGIAAIVVGIVAAYLLLSGLFARCLLYKAATASSPAGRSRTTESTIASSWRIIPPALTSPRRSGRRRGSSGSARRARAASR